MDGFYDLLTTCVSYYLQVCAIRRFLPLQIDREDKMWHQLQHFINLVLRCILNLTLRGNEWFPSKITMVPFMMKDTKMKFQRWGDIQSSPLFSRKWESLGDVLTFMKIIKMHHAEFFYYSTFCSLKKMKNAPEWLLLLMTPKIVNVHGMATIETIEIQNNKTQPHIAPIRRIHSRKPFMKVCVLLKWQNDYCGASFTTK